MSRSYKKTPIYKDKNKFMKKYANRRLRRQKNNLMLQHKEYRKYTCSYDITDYIFRTEFKEYIAMDNKFNLLFNKPPKNRKELYYEWYKTYKRK